MLHSVEIIPSLQLSEERPHENSPCLFHSSALPAVAEEWKEHVQEVLNADIDDMRHLLFLLHSHLKQVDPNDFETLTD